MTGYGTPSVALATTPTVISTFFSHILHRRKRKSETKRSLQSGGPGGGPENQLTYEEGLKVVRRFLDFASHHGVEEVQAFTAMWVPTPHWVKRDVVLIPEENMREAEVILAKHLSTYGMAGENGGGIQLVGGDKWWRVRRKPLEGEWIEMQKDYLKRTQPKPPASASAEASSPVPPSPVSPNTVTWTNKYLPSRKSTTASVVDNSGQEVGDDRIILYIHGGAFFFSSLETHRYQVQRHARKAGARAFSPAYRLSPQYPFPCGLLDCLASYLYLISPPPSAPHKPILPTNIIFMGDSAGAGMCVSLLVLIREMGLPMPAGASLISPWVDLTHSMPSIGGWDGGDFIPSSGFHYKPSCAWPPLPGSGIDITMADGSTMRVDEQVQMYCPNDLLTHPLVSPVNQGSLGGLCPLLVLGGGAELLRDEIVYLAHKAADPERYPPSSSTLAEYPDQVPKITNYKPTKVHLQIYEGCCHVVPTMSWTKSSKYMYRACANFNIWAFNAAHKALEKKLQHKKSSKSLKKSRSSASLKKTALANGLSSLTIPDSSNGGPQSAHSSKSSPTSFTTSPTNLAPSPINTTSPLVNSASPTPPSPAISTSSSQQNTLDLTQPIITSSAASAANGKPISFSEAQSEAESEEEDEDSSSDDGNDTDEESAADKGPRTGVVTVNGTEPLFGNVNIVPERVSTHGNIRPFEDIAAVPALQPGLREHIGRVHGEGAVQKWLNKRADWDKKYSRDLAKWRKLRTEDRAKAEKDGFLTRDLQGENPPMCAVAGLWDEKLAGDVARSVDEVYARSAALGWWTKWGSKADKEHAEKHELREIKSRAEEESKLRTQSLDDLPSSSTSTPTLITPPAVGSYGKFGSREGSRGQLFVEPEAILEDADGEEMHETEGAKR
ncbi:hypothetical protein L202_04123 [Cryptococcus amylolentus CBS 6039]|uniref:Alpha/beta hydrolase fold-3 domain-containing protein n=1 Tax=Cryptococcus amylolentus CBS 6039 TaxID=1295533 RepID=A0A1E3HQ92_9TREE|nr:hypothetical protein L202_04123 [Cryptococcus amylolentus CBS 6039]ODN78492.1 hypothetical protein L202_04123 [Cryptococcus amylolentus CBS 6039]